MRSEMHEPGQGRLAASTRATAEAKATLPPAAIDEGANTQPPPGDSRSP